MATRRRVHRNRKPIEYKHYCRIVTGRTVAALEKAINGELARVTSWSNELYIEVELHGVAGYRAGKYMQMLLVRERHGLPLGVRAVRSRKKKKV